METPPNFRQMNYRNSKKDIAKSQKLELELRDEVERQHLIEILTLREQLDNAKKEIASLLLRLEGGKTKAAIYQARYRQRKKEQTKDTL